MSFQNSLTKRTSQVLVLFFVSLSCFATPKTELSEAMKSRYSELQNENKWKEFVSQNSDYFPNPSEVKNANSVKVIKEDVKARGDEFTVGISYRQAVVNAPFERVKTVLSRPDLFHVLYELDKEAHTELTYQPGDKLPTEFVAHISKKLPSVLPDQDYKLKYIAKQDGKVWFQQVTQIEDKTDFALRETLVVVEPLSDNKTVFREIGKLYPLQWIIRQMGPQIRSITKDELTKLYPGFACVTESSEPISLELVKKCKQSKGK